MFYQRMEKELLYPCGNYLAVEVSHNSRDAKIQCSPRAEHPSSVVGVKSGDFNSRTSFAQQYGNYIFPLYLISFLEQTWFL